MKIVTNLAILIILSAVLLRIAAFFLKEFISNYFVRIDLNNIDTPNENYKLLVFAPHCDDEVLGAGELIKKTIQSGGKVKVILMTNGDGFKDALKLDYLNFHPKSSDYIKFGYDRQKETISALKLLGIDEKNIIFLGYPDGGMSFLWNSNWNVGEPFTSTYTQTNKSPYINNYTKDVLYSGENVVNDITKIIEDYSPTHIVFPHPNDRHPDHWATNAFVKYVLASINYTPKEELLYLVHSGDWPTPLRKNTNMFLNPPAKLTNLGTSWYALSLNNDDINEKTSIINCYRTQKKTLGLLLSAFERKNELFGKYDDLNMPALQRQDSDIVPSNKNKIIADATQDALRLNLSRSSDIAAIYMELSQNKNLHLFIETRGNIESETIYTADLVLFNDEKISRLNLDIRNNHVNLKHISQHSINNILGIKIESEKKFIHIIIPNEALGCYKKLFIAASTSTNAHVSDKTAYRMILNISN